MSVVITHKQFDLPTSLGNFTLTDTRLGMTPKVCLFDVTRVTTNGTHQVHASMSKGVCNATDERASAVDARDGQVTTWTHRVTKTDRCIVLLEPDDTQAIEFEASFVSFQNNSVTLNIATNAPDGAYKVNVTFIAGTDVSSNIQSFNVPTTKDTYNTISGVGFEADLVLPCSIRGGDGTRYTQGTLAYGVVTNQNSTVKQYSIGRDSANSVGTSEITGVISDSYGLAFTKQGTAVLNYAVEFSDFTSTGFRVYSRVLNAVSSDDHWFVALNFNSKAKVYCGGIDTPTTTGSKSYTGFGFEPQFYQIQVSQGISYDTLHTSGSIGGTIGTGQTDGTNETCYTISEEDNVGTSDAQSLVDDDVLNFPDDNGTAFFVATHTSMVSDGVTMNFSTTNGTSRKGFIWAIEDISSINVLKDFNRGINIGINRGLE